MDPREEARTLLEEWRGEDYVFGVDVIDRVGEVAAQLGKKAVVVCNKERHPELFARAKKSLDKHGVSMVPDTPVPGPRPNAPREDVYLLETYLLHYHPELVITIGGGSSIDAVKAAIMLACLGSKSPDIETFFGTGQATAVRDELGVSLTPHLAVMTAASSAAHLTKYSNVTDPVIGQKKLIVDEAIVPDRALFDYATTASAPGALTIDGALDTISHTLEVFYGIPDQKYELAKRITTTAIRLVVQYAKRAVEEPGDLEAREALGLAADLGGYAIMVGGTNGAHLTSFSLVDVTSHGRACGVMNPYYAVFFAPAVEKQLRAVGQVYAEAGFTDADLDSLSGRELGEEVAKAMVAFNVSIGAERRLTDFAQFTDQHIGRALEAAKNPQLEMKLKNMPVPLNAAQVDEYMGPVLQAAKTGDFSHIKMQSAS